MRKEIVWVMSAYGLICSDFIMSFILNNTHIYLCVYISNYISKQTIHRCILVYVLYTTDCILFSLFNFSLFPNPEATLFFNKKIY